MLEIRKLVGATTKRFCDAVSDRTYTVELDDGVVDIPSAQLVLSYPFFKSAYHLDLPITSELIFDDKVDSPDINGVKDKLTRLIQDDSNIMASAIDRAGNTLIGLTRSKFITKTYMNIRDLSYNLIGYSIGSYSYKGLRDIQRDPEMIKLQQEAINDNRLIVTNQKLMAKKIKQMDTTIGRLAKFGIIKPDQLIYGWLLRGWVFDVDDTQFKTPIAKGTLDIDNVMEYMLNLRDSAITQLANANQLGTLNVLGKTIINRTNANGKAVAGDCGAGLSDSIPIRITKENAISLIGTSGWIDGEEVTLKVLGDITPYIGKRANLRSPLTCKRINNHICHRCVGSVVDILPNPTDLTTMAPPYTGKLWQMVMSIKYTMAHFDIMEISYEAATPLINITRRDGAFRIAAKAFKSITFRLLTETIGFVDDLYQRNMSFNTIETVDIITVVGTKKETVTQEVGVPGSLGSIGVDLLDGIREGKATVKQAGKYVNITLTDSKYWKGKTMFLASPPKLENVSRQVRRVTSIIEVPQTVGKCTYSPVVLPLVPRLIETAIKIDQPMSWAVASMLGLGMVSKVEPLVDHKGKSYMSITGESVPGTDANAVHVSKTSAQSTGSVINILYIRQSPNVMFSTMLHSDKLVPGSLDWVATP